MLNKMHKVFRRPLPGRRVSIKAGQFRVFTRFGLLLLVIGAMLAPLIAAQTHTPAGVTRAGQPIPLTAPIEAKVPDNRIQAGLVLMITVLIVVVVLLVRQLQRLQYRYERRLVGLTEQLQQQNASSEQLSQLNQSFVVTMSHELRTPLHGILGAVQLLIKDPHSSFQHEYVERIQKSAELMNTLIEKTLTFSRMETIGINRQDEQFLLRELLDEVRDMLITLAKQKSLFYENNLAVGVPEYVYADRGHLSQVLVNLVGNAIKYTQSGGVSVRVMNESSDQGIPTIRFEVIDTGKGISWQAQESLFQPFFREDSSNASGAGLGLSICRQIMAELGGEVGVFSSPGEGSCFWFTLPLLNNTLVSTSESNHAQCPTPEWGNKQDTICGLRILVVDDVETNRQIARAMLSQDKHQVTLAESAQDALSELVDAEFDLILMDIKMPVMDGVQLTRMLRQQNIIADCVPIIAMTALANPEHVRRYLDAGMQNVLAKPVKLAVLQRTIYQTMVVSRQRANDHSDLTNDTPETAPLIGIEQLQSMQECLSQERFLHYVAKGKTQCNETMALLQRSAADLDAEQYIKLAHKLASSTSQLGLLQVAARALRIESQGLLPQEAANDTALTELQRCLLQSFDALEAYYPN